MKLYGIRGTISIVYPADSPIVFISFPSFGFMREKRGGGRGNDYLLKYELWCCMKIENQSSRSNKYVWMAETAVGRRNNNNNNQNKR